MDPSIAHHFHPALFFLVCLPLIAITIILIFIPYWFIFKKAGFTPWLSLLMFVPLGNIVMLYVLAFSRWKVVPAPGAPGYTPLPPTA